MKSPFPTAAVYVHYDTPGSRPYVVELSHRKVLPMAFTSLGKAKDFHLRHPDLALFPIHWADDAEEFKAKVVKPWPQSQAELVAIDFVDVTENFRAATVEDILASSGCEVDVKDYKLEPHTDGTFSVNRVE